MFEFFSYNGIVRRALWIALCLAFVLGCGATGSTPRVVDGVLDLRQYDVANSGPIVLRGEWEFFAAEPPLESFEPDPAARRLLQVPGDWGKMIPPSGFPGSSHGFGIYGLKILLPPNAPDLALRVRPLLGPFVIEANDARGGVGRVGPGREDVRPDSRPLVLPLRSSDGEVLVRIRMANFHYHTGGINRSDVYLGTPEDLRDQDRRGLGIILFLIGALTASGLYHLSVFHLRRTEFSPLFFGLVCLIWMVRLLVIEDRLLMQILDSVDFEWNAKLMYLSFTTGLPAFVFYIRALYPQQFSRHVARLVLVFGISFSLLVLLTPARVYTSLLIPFEIILLMTTAYIFFVVGRAALRGVPDTWILIAGMAVYAATLLNDIGNNHELLGTPDLASLGIFLFLFSQAYLLSSRNAATFRREEELSASLEVLADERNRHLQSALTDLRAKDDLIQQELDIAAEVQAGTHPDMPAHIGDTYVTAYSRSHGKVGGDFYELLSLGGERAGVLIADVSGHGVPAALVANMARMSFREEARRRVSPRSILERVNASMARLIGTQEYITAFFLVIAPDGKTHFSNAAHRHPAVIRKNGNIEYLRADGLLLGAFETEDNSYEEGRTRLERGDRVVLFTDGLLDLFMDGDPDDWESNFTRFLEERSALSADDLRGELIRHLAAGERSKLLSDDITFMIVERTG